LELCHRLPRLWRRVQAGDLPAWRARRIAHATMTLPQEGARFVDDRVAAFAHKVGPATVDRLVEEALVRFDPHTAQERAEAAAEHRHVTVHTNHVDVRGTVYLSGELDPADALDLDQALDEGARRLAALGAPGSHQARRAAALGDLARLQPTLEPSARRGTTTLPARAIERWCCTCISPPPSAPAAAQTRRVRGSSWRGWTTPARS
jgi:hypothetical protein